MILTVADDIELRLLSPDDAKYIFRTIDTERAYLREWLPFVDYTQKVEDSIEYVQSTLNSIEKQFGVYHCNTFVGLIGCNRTDMDNKRTEIGYWLSEKMQGKGIIIRSVYRLLAFAFNEWGMNRVQIRVAVDNVKSKKIPEKLGFYLEGIERDGELLVDNKFTDIAVYSLLKKEFQE